MMNQSRYFDIILGLFVAVLLISNIASSKILILGPFTFDGGTILFPISYIFGDILTEVYGYAKSRRVIWTGFAASLLMSLVFLVVGKLPSAPEWQFQDAYDRILGITPRIVLASLIAYFAGEFSNSFTLAKMKIATSGRWLWSRTIGSTLIGQAVDTSFFILIAFYGTYSSSLLWAIFISNYIFKVAFEIIFTPLTYGAVGFLKRKEGLEVFDRNTNFNPFAFRTKEIF